MPSRKKYKIVAKRPTKCQNCDKIFMSSCNNVFCSSRCKKTGMELKINARVCAATAINRGDLIRQPCIVCGNNRSQAHHEDYNKPLDVIWYCAKHHAEYHKNKRKKEEAELRIKFPKITIKYPVWMNR